MKASTQEHQKARQKADVSRLSPGARLVAQKQEILNDVLKAYPDLTEDEAREALREAGLDL